MNKNLNHLTWVILLGFMVVTLSLVFWSVFASDGMLARSDNPRAVEAEQAVRRGTIFDRNGQVLAQMVNIGTSPSGKELVRRDYPHPEAASAVGYYSLVHGVGGIEAAYDKVLRGDDQPDPGQDAVTRLFHIPQVGSDLRLTIDAKLQAAVAAAFKGRKGAVIVLDVTTGATLALVSAPTFDPNQLNATYETLRKDPTAPLLNRVTQGIYQPGGSLETVILAAVLGDKKPLDTPVNNAMIPLEVNKLRLSCAGDGQAAATIEGAYVMACPATFADAAAAAPTSVQREVAAFGLLLPPPLISFETAPGALLIPFSDTMSKEELRTQGAGQGTLTVTPLHMALVAATIANHGNSITPYVAEATRAPGETAWKPIPLKQVQNAVLTQGVSDQIRVAMRNAVASGAARAAAHPGLTIYGHASIAYTGNNSDAWFIGFVDLPDGRSVAVAVVVEDAADPAAAAGIGGLALANAAG